MLGLSCHHIALKTLNLPALRRFYENVLGLNVLEKNHYEDGSLRSVWYELGTTILMLEKSETTRDLKVISSFTEDPPGFHLMALEIEKSQREIWKKKLLDAGIVIEHESKFSIYFKDPDGNRLGLTHYPEK